MQESESTAPSLVAKVPDRQFVQTDDADRLENVPAGQGIQL